MSSANIDPPGYDRLKEVKEFDESKVGVKGLSDSGITSIPRIFIHPPETLTNHETPTSKTSTGIPIIDLSNLNSNQHRPNIVNQIREAASTWGFFQLINHGIPASILDDTIAAIKGFHEQPQEMKEKLYKRDNEIHGIMFASNYDLYRSKAATWHDSLKVPLAPDLPKLEEIPEICRQEVVAWDKNATKLVETLEELLAQGLGLEAGKFKELTFSDVRVLIGHCYPYCPQPDLTWGIKSHTDPILLTVLLQNHVPGLQVKHGEEWVDVKPVAGGLIINIGDLLQVSTSMKDPCHDVFGISKEKKDPRDVKGNRDLLDALPAKRKLEDGGYLSDDGPEIISNGEYKSVKHRVLANSFKEPRISVVTFVNLGKWKGSGYYGPLPELLSPDKPAIYRDFTMEEYIENFFSKELDSKSLIDKIKINS